METVFECPHCSRAYPVLPTLVGRKVRCTFCKNIFQLQHDGIALRINIKSGNTEAGSGDGSADAALEPNKSDSQISAKEPLLKVEHKAGVTAGVRPQTKAIRRKTERIKKIRSSLQSAAQEAIENVQEQESVGNPAASTFKKPGGTVRSSEVVLSKSGERDQRYRGKVTIIVLAIAVLMIVPLLFDGSVERVVLKSFSATVDTQFADYPHRIPAYRKRMWTYTRDGMQGPALVINAENAVINEAISIDWPQVVSICAVALDGKVLNRRFAMWNAQNKNKDIEKVWIDYPDKVNIEGFYQLLTKKKIIFVRYRDLLQSLIRKGFADEAVYVASIFLIGTSDEHGSNCISMGLTGGGMPTSLIINEFTDEAGLELIDAGGFYNIIERKHYCGLIVRFSGFADQEDESRILDIRIGKAMREFYKAAFNPLRLAAEHAESKLRNQGKMNRPQMSEE